MGEARLEHNRIVAYKYDPLFVLCSSIAIIVHMRRNPPLELRQSLLKMKFSLVLVRIFVGLSVAIPTGEKNQMLYRGRNIKVETKHHATEGVWEKLLETRVVVITAWFTGRVKTDTRPFAQLQRQVCGITSKHQE